MKIILGIDFDNTIINYEKAFINIAKKFNLKKNKKNISKKLIKNYFIKNHREREWTKLQGIIYGKKIFQGQPFPHLKKSLNKFLSYNELNIVSHRTIKPIIGGDENLHNLAKSWLIQNKIINNNKNFEINKNVFFETTVKKKIKRIIDLKCSHFIDDLPEILEALPSKIIKILFNPQKKNTKFISMYSWKELEEIMNDEKKKYI